MTYTPKMVASHEKNPLRRRDYELIAHVISKLPIAQRIQIANHFNNHLANLSNYDSHRFLEACLGE